MSYLIKYEYPGTTNGRPVGWVYVEQFENLDIYSHTYDPSRATRFSADEADTLLRLKSWKRHGGHRVAVAMAEVLDRA